jgi:uncharacterized membrane protein YraQ (UPF0718 family)
MMASPSMATPPDLSAPTPPTLTVARVFASRLAALFFGLLPTVGSIVGVAWLLRAGAIEVPDLSSPDAAWAFLVAHPLTTVAALQLAYMVLQSACHVAYRPVAPQPDATLPTVTW